MPAKSIKELLDIKNRKEVFVQIGTNDGLDLFHEMANLYKPKLIVLIEPNKNLIDCIKTNYEGINGVHIENVAITNEEKDDVILYIPGSEEKGIPKVGYDTGHFSLLPMNDWGEKDGMITIHAKGITINSIFEKYNIKYVDYLCVDTEGYDAQILKTIDFLKIPIDIIIFESWLFQPEVFTKHNANWEFLGAAAYDEIHKILSLIGYDIYDDSDYQFNKIAVTNREKTWKN